MGDTSDMSDWVRRGGESLIGNYARSPVVFERGAGSHLFDATGREYLDLFAGFGGAVLGHCHPALVEAAAAQATKLWHVGNAFHTEPQIQFAETLKRTSFDGRAFFCHSGLEANEAAVKLARLRGQANGDQTNGGQPNAGERWKTISLNKSFHGRSLAMIAATGNPAVKAGFGPAVPGFVNVEPGDIAALEAAIDDETCCVLMEPIQGEGGVNLYPSGYAAAVRRLCDTHGLTLIFDEVWTGCGRTGKWFGHQHFTDDNGAPVLPDVMTLGKAVGGGLPVGVMFARPELAAMMVPGKHGSTLGGNPICMSVSRAIFDVIERDGLLAHATRLGDHAMTRLRETPAIRDKVAAVRGVGLFIGVELATVPTDFMPRALEAGLILNVTSQKVIRLAPPINIEAGLWEQGITRVIDLIAGM